MLLLVLVAAPLAAQGLPGLQQFEVQDVRLVLLDADGNRRGTLEGSHARKQRDGKVSITAAVLTLAAAEGRLVARAPGFVYRPDSEAFECPQGLSGELPDGGAFSLESATGTIRLGPEPVLKAAGTGKADFRSGEAGRALIRAEVPDPELELRARVTGGRLEIAGVVISGRRGGEVFLRSAALPSPRGRPTAAGTLALGCFGDVNLRYEREAGRCEVSLLRRARIAVDGAERDFEVTANRIRLRGRSAGTGEPEGTAPGLEELELDADGAVNLRGDGFEGFGNELAYREPQMRRELTLGGNPSLDLDQTPHDGAGRVLVRMKSRRSIRLVAPLAPPGVEPESASLTLSDGVQLWRESAGRVEWRISGRVVELEFVALAQPPGLPGAQGPQRREYFRVEREGYAALLRVAEGASEQGQRAAVFGARAWGTIERGRLDAEIGGPDILATLQSDQRLADEMRYALGLRARPDHAQTRPGLLVVRAAASLRLALALGRDPGAPLDVSARGAVELEHSPLPRDDRDLVTFTGDFAALGMAGPRVTLARLDGRDCLATLGYDLLLSNGFHIRADAPDLQGTIAGPGRLVARDVDSIGYFRRVLARLPRRQITAPEHEPDAGWMNFAGDVNLSGDRNSRGLTARGVELRLVHGEFERPRAGRVALRDLGELEDSDVRGLYFARGDRLLILSTGHGTGPQAVVNLMRLEGNALVRAAQDGIEAAAEECIEAGGADDQRAAGNPLSLVLLGKPLLVMDDAGALFGPALSSDTFAYDGAWRVTAGQRLEVTFRPLAAGDPAASAAISADLRHVSRSDESAPWLLHRAHRARAALQAMADLLPPARAAESDQVREALAAAVVAELALRQAVTRETGVAADAWSRFRAARRGRRAAALLAGLIEVAGSGGVDGRFTARDGDSPPVDLAVGRLVVTFNGAGEVVDVSARDGVRLGRADYVITGSALSQAADGTLRLDSAAITLPDNTGITISGVREISLRHRARDDQNPAAARSLVTRVTGQGLKVNVNLGGRR
ncbi:MAG: hypothetical protein KJ044_08575 [Planctomycetes bacterium]|nr:hypothetical protein [Planctomycetota bacterium]